MRAKETRGRATVSLVFTLLSGPIMEAHQSIKNFVLCGMFLRVAAKHAYFDVSFKLGLLRSRLRVTIDRTFATGE